MNREMVIKRLFCSALAVLAILATTITSNASDGNFVHTGGLHSRTDLERMKTKVEAGEPNEDPAYLTFDQVMLEQTPSAPPTAPEGLNARSLNSHETAHSWTNPSDHGTGIKIESSTDGTLFYEIADLAAGATGFVNTGLADPLRLTYRIRAYNTGGYSPYSGTASILPTATE